MSETRLPKARSVWLTKGFWLGFLGGLAVFLLVLSTFFPWGFQGRSRELAKRVACAAHMNAIGKGMSLYTGSNRDVYPPDLAHLVLDGQGEGLFVCPSRYMAGGSTFTEQQMNQLLVQGQHATLIQQFPAYSDYIYIRGHTKHSDASEVLLFELPANHDREAANTLFADGHVGTQLRPAGLVEALRQTNDTFALRRGSQP